MLLLQSTVPGTVPNTLVVAYNTDMEGDRIADVKRRINQREGFEYGDDGAHSGELQ